MIRILSVMVIVSPLSMLNGMDLTSSTPILGMPGRGGAPLPSGTGIPAGVHIRDALLYLVKNNSIDLIPTFIDEHRTYLAEHPEWLDKQFPDSGNTILHHAVIYTDIAIFKYLVEAGARYDIKNKMGKTVEDSIKDFPQFQAVIAEAKKRAAEAEAEGMEQDRTFGQFHPNEYAVWQAGEAFVNGKGTLEEFVATFKKSPDLMIEYKPGITLRDLLNEYVEQGGPNQEKFKQLKEIVDKYLSTGEAELPTHKPVSVPSTVTVVPRHPGGGDPREWFRRQHPAVAALLDALKTYDNLRNEKPLLAFLTGNQLPDKDFKLSPLHKMPVTQIGVDRTILEVFYQVNDRIAQLEEKKADRVEEAFYKAVCQSEKRVGRAEPSKETLRIAARAHRSRTGAIAQGVAEPAPIPGREPRPLAPDTGHGGPGPVVRPPVTPPTPSGTMKKKGMPVVTKLALGLAASAILVVAVRQYLKYREHNNVR